MSHLKALWTVSLALLLVPGALHGQAPASTKRNNLAVSIAADLTQATGQITWVQTGSMQGCNTTLTNPDPILFNLGAGSGAQADIHQLCGQTLQSAWTVRGVFQDGQTTFPGFGAEPYSSTEATATWNVAGTASSATTVTVGTFSANPIPATIGKDGLKDDASLASAVGVTAEAQGYLGVLQNSRVAMEVLTYLGCTNGASVTLDSTGLTLLAEPGQAAAFEADLNDYIGSSFAGWSVSYDGTRLTVQGIDPGLFVPVDGGYFLAYDDMPGEDVTENVVGEIEIDATATALVADFSSRMANLRPAGPGAGWGDEEP
jgi:hypothetical protein